MKVTSKEQVKVVYTCTYCQQEYTPKVASTPYAKNHSCGRRACRLEEDRRKKLLAREAAISSGMSWSEMLNRFQPGDVITEVVGKISGGRFTANGGAQITLNVNSVNKHMLVDLTDFSGMPLRVVFSRPPSDEDENEDGEGDDGDFE